MNPFEPGFSVINIIVTPPKIAIEYADGIDLLDLVILLASIDMFRDCLAYYTLEIVQLTGELHLYDDNVTFTVAGLYVNSIELIVLRILVTLTLKKFLDLDLFTGKYR